MAVTGNCARLRTWGGLYPDPSAIWPAAPLRRVRRDGWSSGRWPLIQVSQELGDRVRDLGRPAARKVVADLIHKLHAGIGQERGQLMGGADGNECVVRVGDQQHRLCYAGQRRGEPADLVDQRPLLGEEAAPHRP